VQAEYRSASLTSELLHLLIVTGVSPDTLETARRIVRDELDHAEICHAVISELGPADQEEIDPNSLFLAHDQGAPAPLRALSAVADLFCCGETVAVPLFLAIRADASEDLVLPALDRIVRDEAVHRKFGWDTAAELLDMLGPLGAAWLNERVPGYLDKVQTAYRGPERANASATAKWGLMSPHRYGEIVAETVEQVIRPRFRALGIAV